MAAIVVVSLDEAEYDDNVDWNRWTILCDLCIWHVLIQLFAFYLVDIVICKNIDDDIL